MEEEEKKKLRWYGIKEREREKVRRRGRVNERGDREGKRNRRETKMWKSKLMICIKKTTREIFEKRPQFVYSLSILVCLFVCLFACLFVYSFVHLFIFLWGRGGQHY